MKIQKNENNNIAKIKTLVKELAPKVSELKYGNGDDEFIVKVYPILPFTKRIEMVREIVNGVFMDKKDTVDNYMPEFLTLMQKYTVIKFFTDLTLPRKIDDMWLVLNHTSIYEDVINIVGISEVEDIFNAANKAIDTYRQYLTTKTDVNSLINKIGGAVNDFGNKISQEDIMSITSKIKDIPKGTSLQELIASLFNNKND